MKIIFLGTPEFSVSVLKELVKTHHEIVAVVSQPDKPVGRKQILTPTPVKVFANEHKIKVFQFEKIRKQGVEPLKALNADCMVTVAYGQILSKELLELTKFGTINVHGSILPKYRGAAPFQWALINGEKKTGVTIMKSDVGIDDGDIITSGEFDIDENDNLDSLYQKASVIGSKLLIETLDKLEKNEVKFIKQNESEASYYPMLKKEISYIDFNMKSFDIVNLIKGISNWPTATIMVNNLRLNIYEAKIYNDENLNLNDFKNGEVAICSGKKGIVVKASDGFVELKKVQFQGGKIMDGKSLANGNKLKERDVLTKIS